MSEPAPSASPADPAGPATGSRAARSRGWCRRSLGWTARGLGRVGQFLLIAWAALAIYYSNLPWFWARVGLGVAFVVFAVWTLWVTRRRGRRRAFVMAYVALVVWWVLIPASNDRPWRPEVSRTPRAVIDGDRVRLMNFRNFRYRTREDFDVRFEEREVDVSRIVSVDLFISYWVPGPVGHTFVSFNLDDGSPPVCISIETRPEVGEGFDPLASMFKQFELIYVVGDERDVVRVRTDYRDEEVFLYHTRATPEASRALFRLYLDRINSLDGRPEWYHLLRNNCTINIIRYSRSVGAPHRRFEIRHLLNGLIDRYLFQIGIIDTSLEFDELRRVSRINEAAGAAGDADDFSEQIRRGLPVPGESR